MTMITKKDLQEAIDKAIVEIIESISKIVATKDELTDGLNGVKREINEVKADVKDIKRQINDLKADTPTPQEFTDHDKRITKLETAVFPQ